jgi:hypothetical protein
MHIGSGRPFLQRFERRISRRAAHGQSARRRSAPEDGAQPRSSSIRRSITAAFAREM